MLDQLSRALTFYAMYIASKVGATGLTVTVDVYEATTGAPIVSDGNATELAGGLYYYQLASGSVDNAGAYIAVFKTADSSVDQQHIPALWVAGLPWVERVDADVSSREADGAAASALTAYDPPTRAEATTDKAEILAALPDDPPTAAAVADAVWDEAIADHDNAGSTGESLAAAGSAGDPWITDLDGGGYTAGQAGYVLNHLSDRNITFSSPVVDDETIEINQDTDYLATDGRELEWSGVDAQSLNLTGATAELVISRVGAFDGTVTDSGDGNMTITVELTAAQTAAAVMPAGTRDFEIVVTDGDDHIAKPISGKITVYRSVPES